jgi:uncharacterized glyoxalase superfamily protein PhnB
MTVLVERRELETAELEVTQRPGNAASASSCSARSRGAKRRRPEVRLRELPRRKEHAMEHPTVFPSLRYDDAAAAVDFLVSAFGAGRHAVYAADDGTIRHAELRFGNGMAMLGSASPELAATRGGGGGVYVVVDDPDRHCARARAAGAEITREPQDTDYGSREYSARDPEGNDWHFGTYQPFAYEPAAAETARPA